MLISEISKLQLIYNSDDYKYHENESFNSDFDELIFKYLKISHNHISPNEDLSCLDFIKRDINVFFKKHKLVIDRMLQKCYRERQKERDRYFNMRSGFNPKNQGKMSEKALAKSYYEILKMRYIDDKETEKINENTKKQVYNNDNNTDTSKLESRLIDEDHKKLLENIVKDRKNKSNKSNKSKLVIVMDDIKLI